MQESISPMRLLESQNRYPDCLSMELKAIPLQSNLTDTGQVDLYLTVSFNEQWIDLLNGRVKFGLKGGELELGLENGEMAAIYDLDDSKFRVVAKGSKANPAWFLLLKTSDPVLKGSLKQAKLGTVNLRENSSLTATFVVSPPDIYLTDTEGLWRHDITPNKHGVLERKLANFLQETQLQPYVSRVQLGTKDLESGHSSLERAEVDRETICQAPSQLEAIIQRIYEADTNDFHELAKLADLNPMTDFAGGNLLATELSGVEFGGADLYRINLRGAVLTDADFSEANLSYAKLSGADLSGAYLGNANLNHADLHRASLALANLIGADLSAADLREVNFSNANLSGAKVSQAQFGNNPGLTEETMLSLKQRGAIFE